MHFNNSNKVQHLGGKATGVQPSRGQQPQRAPPGLKGVVANPPAGLDLMHRCTHRSVVPPFLLHPCVPMLLLAVKWSDIQNHDAVKIALVARHLTWSTRMQIVSAILFCVYEVIRVDMKAGALGVAVHWSMKSDWWVVCLRFGPQTAGSGLNAPWSHPVEASPWS